MATMGVFCLCLLFAMISSITARGVDRCYAYPYFYGSPKCPSSRSIFGRHGTKVKYTIDPVSNVGTLICCVVKACGPKWSNRCFSGQFYGIGCSSSRLSATFPWGNSYGIPAIQCKARTQFGTFVRWSHTP